MNLKNIKVITAIISALAVIAAALITSNIFHKTVNTDNYHYLNILNVSLNTQIPYRGIRISGRINETNFSFPTNGLVIRPDIYLPHQQFIIKKENARLECYFEVIMLDDSCRIYDLKPPNSFLITDFLYSGVYKIDLSDSNPESNIKCQIEFKIY